MKPHTPNIAKFIARAAACCLVAASTAFGAAYAWQAGVAHDLTIHGVPVIAAVTVVMVIGLEIAKPLAIAAAFEAFRRWRIFQGAALALLGVAAIAYSLTAELSLFAGLRSDNTAKRQQIIDQNARGSAEVKRQVRRQDDARKELTGLAPARPAAELKALIGGLFLTPGADGCTEINGGVTRKVCPQVASLKAELGRAMRHTELEAILAAPVAVGVAVVGDEPAKAIASADPGAAALSTYANALGFKVPADLISRWLPLVGVLALEIGAAFSGVLVGEIGGHEPRPEIKARAGEPALGPAVHEPAETPVFAALDHVNHSPMNHVPAVTAGAAVGPRTVDALDRARDAILNGLRERGELVGGERQIAEAVGATRSTTRRALHALAAVGVIAILAGHGGTIVRLA